MRNRATTFMLDSKPNLEVLLVKKCESLKHQSWPRVFGSLNLFLFLSIFFSFLAFFFAWSHTTHYLSLLFHCSTNINHNQNRRKKSIQFSPIYIHRTKQMFCCFWFLKMELFFEIPRKITRVYREKSEVGLI